MKRLVAHKVAEMAPSGIRVFFDIVLGMKDVISLGVGEPDFVTPWRISEAGIFAIEQGYTSYTSNKGMMKLRLLIARDIKRRCGLEYNPDDEILITVGVSEAVDLAYRAMLEPGDEVLVPMPAYVSYAPLVDLAGGKAVYVETMQDGFKLTPRSLERAITPRTKAIILNYPANPTGISYTRRELETLKKVFHKHDIFVLSDEIYGDLTYDYRHTVYPALAGARDRTLYLNGFSKSFAMTGWRIGYACGPKELIAAMTKIHQYTILCPPIAGQMAACEALENGQADMERMKREYRRRRNMLTAAFDELRIPYIRPEGAFYLFADFSCTKKPALEFAKELLEEEKVALVPGTAFGPQFGSWVRMSYATDFDELVEAVKRIGNYLKRHNCRRR